NAAPKWKCRDDLSRAMTSKACDSRERKELYLCPLPDQGNFRVTMVDPVSASTGNPGYGLRTCPFSLVRFPSALCRRLLLFPVAPRMPGRRHQAGQRVGLEKWLELNREYAQKWPNITAKKDMAKDAKAR